MPFGDATTYRLSGMRSKTHSTSLYLARRATEIKSKNVLISFAVDHKQLLLIIVRIEFIDESKTAYLAAGVVRRAL